MKICLQIWYIFFLFWLFVEHRNGFYELLAKTGVLYVNDILTKNRKCSFAHVVAG